MKITAYAPCMRPYRLVDALEDINSQSTPVNSIVVIDNGNKIEKTRLVDFKSRSWWTEQYPNLNILHFNNNIGTNAAWNIGLRSDADYIMFFPDDMRFDHHFVKKAIYTFNDPNVAVVSAKIIPWEEELPKGKEYEFRCGRTSGHGKAGVFMIRGSVARDLPLIPEEYFIFYGDDWIDFHVRIKKRLIWTELRWSCARHEYGMGVSASLKKTVLRREKIFWMKYLEENYEGRLPFRK